jgi:hypothetical protein
MNNTTTNKIACMLMVIIGLITALVMTSCGSVSPTEPATINPVADSVSLPQDSHQLVGLWDFVIEPEVGIVDAIPARTLDAHFNITQVALSAQSCPGCIVFQFGNIGAGGKQDITVTLNNNYAGKIPGYDLKGIILADESADPTSPHQSPWYLTNADDYTNLIGGSVSPGARNPFKAFCPGDPSRKLSVGGSSTLTFKLMFPPAPVDWDKIMASWALDACEKNCAEPYAIENQAVSGGIIPVLGEEIEASVDAPDHQGDAGSVSIDLGPIGGGEASLDKEEGGHWTGMISSSDDTEPGDYKLDITATDSIDKQVKIFDDFSVTVGFSAEQDAIYDKLVGILDDWDDDQLDCVLDELADGWGVDSSNIEDLLEDYILDLIWYAGGGGGGGAAHIEWESLRATKNLVSDLGDLGIDTSMSEFVDALRTALDDCLAGHQGWGNSKHDLPAGLCTLDIGVIGSGALQGHVLYAGNSPNCDQIWKYTPNYANQALYKSLVNLDPANPIFQPWPVLRLDAANDGAFSWTNDNYDYYQDPAYGNQPIPISSIWCTDDNVPSFHAIPIDDSRIFPVPPPPQGNQMRPVDVCDDFDLLQYALVVDPTMMIPPHVWGIKGAPNGKDYTKLDERYSALFGPGMIGPGDGQIEAGVGDFGGIDAWGKSSTKTWLYVAENGGQWAVEVFEITDKGAGFGVDSITAKYTIHFNTQPLDVELVPTNPEYEKNTGVPTIAVLLKSQDGTGYISLHRADNGTLVDTIGTAQVGCFDVQPAFLDVNDGSFEIHVTMPGPKAMIFSLTQLPG